MTTQDVSLATRQLCDKLQKLWQFESFSFTPPLSVFSRKRCAKTVASSDAHHLPNTNFPLRGHDGVELTCPEEELSNSQKTCELIIDLHRRDAESIAESEYKPALLEVNASIEMLKEAIIKDAELSFRLYGVMGYKTYSWDDFIKRKTGNNGTIAQLYFYSVSEILADALVAHQFDPSTRHQFKKWTDVKELVTTNLSEIRNRTEYSYEVRVYLNGPPVDLDANKNIANLSINNTTVHIDICTATDALLEPLVKYKKHPSAQRINTVLLYTFSAPVQASEEVYLREYSNAAKVTEFVIDSLRLIRPKDDIGVLALEVVPTTKFTPYIREPAENRYRMELSTFQPRRFDFSPSSLLALDEKDIDMVRKTVEARLPQKQRFEYAIGRFRNSIERYSPDDPERLLEWAIALESLYLNDKTNDQAELTYRLSLRAARFLKTDRKAREELFLLVRNLYSMRSKIAHGSDINQITKEGDKEKLISVLERGPEILADSILKLLQVTENDNTDPVAFWRDIELS